ncbi:MAG: hypothetical protein ACRDIX_01075 [Actinomycetota bacterium]
MADDIEFLRRLEEDLREAARGEMSGRRRPGLLPGRWGLTRAMMAFAAGVVTVSIVALLTLTLVDRSRPDRAQRPEAPGERVAPVPARLLVPGPTGSQLFAVDASSASDVWAVGGRFTAKPVVEKSLVLHWDGGRWAEVDGPDAVLWDVVAVSPKDVWAISGAKIFHWDGDDWKVARHPNPPGVYFAAIDAAAPDDVWVVGLRLGAKWIDQYGERNVGYDTLIQHWDGTRWTVVPSPNPTRRHNSLNGIVALSPTDAWAVGYAEGATGGPKTMTLHWDGAAWSSVPSPDPGEEFNVLWGMGTDGAGGVWAVGHFGDPEPSRFEALYLRWTGEAWEVVPGPTGEAGHQTPTALGGSSFSDVWAVGSEPTSSLLVAHWEGSEWIATQVEPPILGENTNPSFEDVVVVSPRAAWAVGHYQRPDGRRLYPWVEYWDGSRWVLAETPKVEG